MLFRKLAFLGNLLGPVAANPLSHEIFQVLRKIFPSSYDRRDKWVRNSARWSFMIRFLSS